MPSQVSLASMCVLQDSSSISLQPVDVVLQAYYTLLDQHCEDFKKVVGGGVGWFAHIYSDDQEPGYGIYDTTGCLKFPFAPQTSC